MKKSAILNSKHIQLFLLMVTMCLLFLNCKKRRRNQNIHYATSSHDSDTASSKVDAKNLILIINKIYTFELGDHFGLKFEIYRDPQADYYQFFVCSEENDSCNPNKDNPRSFTLSSHVFHNPPAGRSKVFIRACVRKDKALEEGVLCGPYSDQIIFQPESQDKELQQLLVSRNELIEENKETCESMHNELENFSEEGTNPEIVAPVESQLAMGQDISCEVVSSSIYDEIEEEVENDSKNSSNNNGWSTGAITLVTIGSVSTLTGAGLLSRNLFKINEVNNKLKQAKINASPTVTAKKVKFGLVDGEVTQKFKTSLESYQALLQRLESDPIRNFDEKVIKALNSDESLKELIRAREALLDQIVEFRTAAQSQYPETGNIPQRIQTLNSEIKLSKSQIVNELNEFISVEIRKLTPKGVTSDHNFKNYANALTWWSWSEMIRSKPPEIQDFPTFNTNATDADIYRTVFEKSKKLGKGSLFLDEYRNTGTNSRNGPSLNTSSERSSLSLSAINSFVFKHKDFENLYVKIKHEMETNYSERISTHSQLHHEKFARKIERDIGIKISNSELLTEDMKRYAEVIKANEVEILNRRNAVIKEVQNGLFESHKQIGKDLKKINSIMKSHLSEIEKLHADLIAKKSTLEETEGRLREAERNGKENTALKKEVDSQRAEIDAINDHKAQLEVVFKERQDANVRLSTENSRLSTKLVEIEPQLEKAKSDITKLEENVESQKKSLSQKDVKLENLNREKTELEMKLQAANESISSKKRFAINKEIISKFYQIRQLKDAQEAQIKTLTANESELSQLKGRVQNLEKVNATQKVELERRAVIISQLTLDLEESNRRTNTVTLENLELSRKNASLELEKQKLFATTNEQNSRIFELESSAVQNSDELRRLKDELDSNKAILEENTRLSTENDDKYKKNLDIMQVQLSEKQLTIQNLAFENFSLRQSIETLTRDKDILATENSRLSDENKRHAQSIEELERKLADAENKATEAERQKTAAELEKHQQALASNEELAQKNRELLAEKTKNAEIYSKNKAAATKANLDSDLASAKTGAAGGFGFLAIGMIQVIAGIVMETALVEPPEERLRIKLDGFSEKFSRYKKSVLKKDLEIMSYYLNKYGDE